MSLFFSPLSFPKDSGASFSRLLDPPRPRKGNNPFLSEFSFSPFSIYFSYSFPFFFFSFPFFFFSRDHFSRGLVVHRDGAVPSLFFTLLGCAPLPRLSLPPPSHRLSDFVNSFPFLMGACLLFNAAYANCGGPPLFPAWSGVFLFLPFPFFDWVAFSPPLNF